MVKKLRTIDMNKMNAKSVETVPIRRLFIFVEVFFPFFIFCSLCERRFKNLQ